LFKKIPAVGNIGGRLYFNLTLSYSLYRMTMKPQKALILIEEIFGNLPPEIVEQFTQSFTKIEILKFILYLLKMLLKYKTFSILVKMIKKQ